MILFSGCRFTGVEKNVIRIKGSDTMKNLVKALAQEYMKVNNDLFIDVSGGGTAEGIEALINDEIDICNASRAMKAEEIKRLFRFHNKLGISFLISKDAIVIYVNKNNPLQNLSMEEVKKIFEGKITRWDALGWDPEDIKIATRNRFSGTRLFFEERFLDGNKINKESYQFGTTREIIEYVERNEYAIGYGAYGLKGNVKLVKINSIIPNLVNIKNDRYPVTRYLHFYTVDLPKGEVKSFINWVISEKGQAIIEKEGFVPIWK